MALDISGFVNEAQNFEGLYKSADTLERRKYRDQQLAQQKEGKTAATTKFFADYLDPKDRLTGTNYDPEIVNKLGETLKTASELAAKGASTNDIMMAVGPQVNKINEYSTKAKLVNQQIKGSLEKLKAYPGYNAAALEEEAKKMAFQDEKGGMKDISLVDPNTDWVSKATQERPGLVTTGAGIDDFVKKTPAATMSRNVQTTKGGRTKNVKYEATHPFWMGLQQDEQGGIKTDDAGNPVGLDIVGGPITDDKNQPMINPETGEQYRGMDRGHFVSIMRENPDVADHVRGLIEQHFKDAGAKEMPKEGSAQWTAMGQYVLGDELKRRDKSSFKTIEQEKASNLATKIELGLPLSTAKSSKNGETEIQDIYKEVDNVASSRDRVSKDKGAPLNELSATAQSTILKIARDITGRDLDQRNIYIKKDSDGKIYIMDAKKQTRIAPIDFKDINMQANKGVKSQQQVLKSDEKTPASDWKSRAKKL